jgi:hypothetical protein
MDCVSSSGLHYPRNREYCALDFSSGHFQSYLEPKLDQHNANEIAFQCLKPTNLSLSIRVRGDNVDDDSLGRAWYCVLLSKIQTIPRIIRNL